MYIYIYIYVYSLQARQGGPLHVEAAERRVRAVLRGLAADPAQLGQLLVDLLLREGQPESAPLVREPGPRVVEEDEQLLVLRLPPHDAAETAEDDGRDRGRAGGQQLRLRHQRDEVLHRRGAQPDALALLQVDGPHLVDVVLHERGPEAGGPEVLILFHVILCYSTLHQIILYHITLHYITYTGRRSCSSNQ